MKKQIILINSIMDKNSDNIIKMSWATDKLVWMKKWKKAPEKLLNLMIDKMTLIYEKQWYGDEQISNEINEMIEKL